MDFNSLNALVPKDAKGQTHSNTIYLAGGLEWSVRVKYPGKHKESEGDFLVEVLSKGAWDEYHRFTHGDVFYDILNKSQTSTFINESWVPHTLAIIQGRHLLRRFSRLESRLPGVHIDALTSAMLALSVSEHRRFPSGDKNGGGRYLPINYILAILQGHWTPQEASDQMRTGFPALRRLDGFVPFTHGDAVQQYVSAVHSKAVAAKPV